MNEILELREGLETFLGRGLTLSARRMSREALKRSSSPTEKRRAPSSSIFRKDKGIDAEDSLSRGDSFGREGSPAGTSESL